MSAKTNVRRPLWLGAALALFLLTAAIARYIELTAFEEIFFRLIYEDTGDLRMFALAVTQLGSAWVLLGFSGLLFAVRRLPDLGLLVLRNGLFAYTFTVVVKELVGRPRPAELLTDIIHREIVLRGLGFPSAHTALATAAVLTVWPHVSAPWRWFGVLIVAAVAWSRMYLGVHLPLDILGGLLLGVVVVLTMQYLPQQGMWKSKPKNRAFSLHPPPAKRKLKKEV